MLYRDLHHAADDMAGIHRPLRRAILASSILEMAAGAQQAEAAANQLLSRLQATLHDGVGTLESDTRGGRVESFFAQEAIDALHQVVVHAHRAIDGSDTSAVRGGLLDCKTRADFADAYLRVALGDEAA